MPVEEIRHIRPVAVAAIRRPSDGKYLVQVGGDNVKKVRSFRFLGGGIEFGETAANALRREFMEELGAEIVVGEQIYVRENLFEYEGKPGHEIVFLFGAEFKDKSLYDLDKLPLLEFPGGFAEWMDVGEPRHYGEF